MTIRACRDLWELRAQIATWRAQGDRIALVPTMGALHAGHLSLVDAARRDARRVVVTIFVNPTQFAPSEDFDAYPRDLDADLMSASAAGVDLVFAPEVGTMYPDGFATTINVGGPALAGLEDRFRPAHFSGVATIVAKLFQQVLPDAALFGEKDFQQLCVIQQMVRDLDMPIAIIGVPTYREADGLALSSRNVYLAPDERARAPVLFGALSDCARSIDRGKQVDTSLERARGALHDAGIFRRLRRSPA